MESYHTSTARPGARPGGAGTGAATSLHLARRGRAPSPDRRPNGARPGSPRRISSAASTAIAHPEADPSQAAVAIQQRLPFSRPLTHAERLAVAISAIAPSHFLTIDSRHHDRDAFVASWRRLVKRLARLRGRSRRPLIYVATIAKSKRPNGGYHLHALLWEYLHLPVLRKHVRASGLGHPDIRHVPSPGADYTQVLRVTAYVLGQHEPVFGNRHSGRHYPRRQGARRYLLPQRATLRNHHPSLLAALERAESLTVTDDVLVRAVPKFS